MRLKYRLERCRLDGVKETSDRLTALGGQGWKVIHATHHGAELFVLLELAIDPSQKEVVPQEPKKGPGRPKNVTTSATSSTVGPVEVTLN